MKYARSTIQASNVPRLSDEHHEWLLVGGAWRCVMGVDATILAKTREANYKVCGDSLAKS